MFSYAVEDLPANLRQILGNLVTRSSQKGSYPVHFAPFTLLIYITAYNGS